MHDEKVSKEKSEARINAKKWQKMRRRKEIGRKQQKNGRKTVEKY